MKEKVMIYSSCEKNISKIINDVNKNNTHSSIIILHITNQNIELQHEADFEPLFDISNENGADIYVLKSCNVADTLIKFANNHKVSSIFIDNNLKDRNIMPKLKFYLPDVIINDVA